VLLSWLAFGSRRLGDHLFTTNDAEACWRDWQITKVHGGLGRRYRDPLFDTSPTARMAWLGWDTTGRSDK